MTDLNEHVKKMSGTSNERRVKRVNRQNIEKRDDESGVAKGTANSHLVSRAAL
jgi:hypothetical protein